MDDWTLEDFKANGWAVFDTESSSPLQDIADHLACESSWLGKAEPTGPPVEQDGSLTVDAADPNAARQILDFYNIKENA